MIDLKDIYLKPTSLVISPTYINVRQNVNNVVWDVTLILKTNLN